MGHGSSLQHSRNPGRKGSKEVAAAQGHSSSSSGLGRIECNRCRHVQEVPCGTPVFRCASCGARVWIALSAVAEQAATQVARQLRAAEEAVRATLDEQAGICRGLWGRLQEELGQEAAIWDGGPATEEADTARALLLEAAASCDGAQLAEALAHAEGAGLRAAAASGSLAAYRQEEDLEVLWRCLLRALAAADRVDLEFWREEAHGQGLYVPPEVNAALQALHAAEHARLAELEYQAGVQTRAAEAHGRGDAAALRALVLEARALGADTSPAEAALAGLQDGGPPGAGGPGQGARPERESGGGMAADAFRDLDLPSLRAVLVASGLDPGPESSREKLVRQLLASQAPPQAPGAGPAAPPVGSSGAAQRRPSAPPPERAAQTGSAAGSAGAGASSQKPAPPPPPPPPPRKAPSTPPEAERARGPRREEPQRPPPPPPPDPGPMTRGQALACLGLSGQPGLAEVRRAYKQAALRWHPDRRQNHGRAEEATLHFQRIRAAFEFLQAGSAPAHR